jgi:hypothetical protein
MTPRLRRSRPRRARAATTAALLLLAAAPGIAADPDAAVKEMLRKVVTAPEVVSKVVIERADPFGGPPDRQTGRLWYVPGLGLRYKADGREGQDVSLDKSEEAFLLYAPAERKVYRAPFSRGPARMRKLITEPERVLSTSLHASAASRRIHGATVPGYQLRPGSLDDSLAETAVWIAPDAKTGLPRWLAVDSEADSVMIELSGMVVRTSARLGDLKISAPRGTPEEPLDPRELLERGAGGESR